MSQADAKADLYAAYARGETPAFRGAMPHGLDEAWALGDVLVVLPAVPPNCSPELEFALRLRRGAILTGRCEKCEAVPTLGRKDADLGVPALEALFRHRRHCPARDENVKALLASYHGERAAEDTEEKDFDWAQEINRAKVAPAKVDGIQMSSSRGKTAAVDVLSQLDPNDENVRVCDHLHAHPMQPWNIFIAKRSWKCDQCWAYAVKDMMDGVRIGKNLGPVEEFTCDLCRRYSPNTLVPLLMRIDIFVMHGAVCQRCQVKYAVQPGEES